MGAVEAAMRGVGILRAVTEWVPEWAVPAIQAVTLLGDPALLVVAVTVLYWVGPRFNVIEVREAVRLFAVTMTAVAVVTALKQWFGLPRPPERFVAMSVTGYGFPSGHATAATAVYGGGALVAMQPDTRWRYWGGGTLIGIVALSRIALGVHYFVDVIAGIVVGCLVIGVVFTVTDARLTPGFWLAVIAAGAAVLLTGLAPEATMTEDAALAIGGTIGAAVTWTVVEWQDRSLRPPTITGLVVGVVVAGVPLGYVYLFEGSVLIRVVAAGVGSVVGVGLPAIRTFRDTGRVPTD